MASWFLLPDDEDVALKMKTTLTSKKSDWKIQLKLSFLRKVDYLFRLGYI